jgi:PEGA domain-containing protein
VPTALPVHANVAFLRIAQFDTRPVAEQAQLKEKLEARTKTATAGIPEADRIVLDADDGLAVVMFGDPAKALQVAQALRSGDGSLPVQAGLNYGPLALTVQGSEARVFGDGLTAAAAAARFASAERLLVTQDFAKSLKHRHPDRAAELAEVGDFTDTRVRLHSFYTPDLKKGKVHRRRLLAYGVGGVAAILLLGVAGREARRILTPVLPAVIRLQVRPRGDIYVDGLLKGRTPPLLEIEIPAGPHVIQIRNPGFPMLETNIDLQPGEKTTLAHAFRKPEPPPKPKQEKADFWRDLRRSFGGS